MAACFGTFLGYHTFLVDPYYCVCGWFALPYRRLLTQGANFCFFHVTKQSCEKLIPMQVSGTNVYIHTYVCSNTFCSVIGLHYCNNKWIGVVLSFLVSDRTSLHRLRHPIAESLKMWYPCTMEECCIYMLC